jgi:hypothetical protein
MINIQDNSIKIKTYVIVIHGDVYVTFKALCLCTSQSSNTYIVINYDQKWLAYSLFML